LIEIVKLNEICEIDNQCFKNDQFSKCDAGLKRCKCQDNFMEHNESCWSKINIGAKCQQDTDCQNQTHHTVCKEQHCVCHRGYVAKQDNTVIYFNLPVIIINFNQILFCLGMFTRC